MIMLINIYIVKAITSTMFDFNTLKLHPIIFNLRLQISNPSFMPSN